ncbi:MAG TPA: single-stranded DNA-binding protein [Opitutaceae bacterium]|jgi:single-strand DNA-binding protein|nr:single-stranded DNA-binding protein [Opitutaceae bacterium]
MPYLNKYAFIGNLTKAPELRFQPTGEKQALCILNVAINRDSRDESGERYSHTVYINDIEVWGPSGEACAHFLTMGSMVFVEGRMDVDQWEDKRSGAKRSKMKVVAENVQFLRIRRPEAETLVPSPAPVPAEPPAPARKAARTGRKAAKATA